MTQLNIKHFTEDELNTVLRVMKSCKVAVSMKYLLKYERQVNLMTYFFDYALPYITKTLYRNGPKAALFRSSRKVNSESTRTTVV